MNQIKIFLILLSVTFFHSCCSESTIKNDQDTLSKKSEFITIITNTLGNNYSTIFNANKEFVICIEKRDLDTSKKFVVYEFKSDSIIFSDKLVNGEIKWLNEYDFSVVEFPGIISKTNTGLKPKYIFNVLRKIKI